MKKIARTLVRILVWTLVAIFGLLITVALLIQVPSVQNRLREKAISFLSDKIGTRVGLDHISLSFPKKIVLDGIFLEDQRHDTLLYVGRLSVDTDLFKLLRKQIELNNISITKLKSGVDRPRGGVFNFDYIIQAFSGKEEVVKDTAQAPWDFSIETVSLTDVDVSFYDDEGGLNADVDLSKLHIDVDEFNLNENTFQIDDVSLAGVDAQVTLDERPTEEKKEVETSGEKPMDLDIGSVDLSKINLVFSQTGKQEITLAIDAAAIESNKLDLPGRSIDLEEFALTNSFIAYHLVKGSDSQPVKSDTINTTDSQPWRFSLDELSLSNNSFQYYDFTKEKTDNGFDTNHIWVSRLTMVADEIVFAPDEYHANIDEISFSERAGLDVLSLKGEIAVDKQSAAVNDFYLKTQRSEINLSLKSQFASLEDLVKNIQQATIAGNINNTHIGLRDIQFFVPSVMSKIPLKVSPSDDIHVDAIVDGRVGDFVIKKLNLEMLRETAFAAKGSIAGLPDINNTQFDITLQKFHTTEKDIRSVVIDTLFPSSLKIPAWLDLTSAFSGTIKTPAVKADLKSEFGRLLVQGEANLREGAEQYKGSVSIQEFDLGALLQNQDIGSIDLNTSFNGKGLKKNDHNVKVNLAMNSFTFKDYTYKDLAIDGTVRNLLFNGNAGMDDPNLSFKIDGDFNYDFTGKASAYHFDFNLINADLNALHLTERPLKTRFELTVDLDNASLQDLNGGISFHDVAVYDGEQLYKVDSLLFASIHSDGQTEISLSSDIIDGQFKGSFDLRDLPVVMNDYFNTYYALHDTVYAEVMKPQQFSFDLKIKNTSLFTDILIPDLKRLVPGEMKGEFNSEEKKLDISFNIDAIEYGSITGENIRFDVTSNKNKLDYGLETDRITVASVNIPSLQFKGEVSDNIVNTNLTIYDSLKKERYLIGAQFRSVNEAYRIHLNPGEVLLNYNEWNVPKDNYITFGKKGATTEDFRIENNNQRIEAIAMLGQESPLILAFKDLQLSTLANMVLSQDTLVNGAINGNIKWRSSKGERLLGADIKIENTSLAKNKLGDVVIRAEQTTTKSYDAHLDIKGPASDVVINARYLNDSIPTTNVSARINALDLSAIEPLLFGQARSVTGNLVGNIDVNGSVSKPDINGAITFKNTTLTPTYINSKITLENETVELDKSGIAFNDFHIKDHENHPMTINGSVTSADGSYALDLRAVTNNFLLLNTKEGDNEQFYGRVIVDANARIRGTTDHPEVDLQVSLNDESDLTYLIPRDEKGVLEQKGVVTFVDRDVHKDPFLAAIDRDARKKEDSVSVVRGITLTAKIELDDKETLNIVIDPTTGDKLSVKGNATMTLDIDPTGNMTLSGRYELTSGSYNLTFYKLVKREFEIQKGSTITWSGDPVNGDLDITGIYNVETSPVELLQNQAASMDQQAKQRLPFIVHLIVKGKILTPEISFNLDMPESQRNALGGSVYARLQDINTRESDLNKQVFALLILKRFVAENPFDNQGGGGLESTARTSVSRFLTEQLNQMSEQIKGVELTFDVKSFEEYQDGQSTDRTQLQLGLSKNLFSDRLVVKLAGNIDIEGQQQAQQDFSDYIGDLALEYKITDDGRLRVTGFYNSDYDMIDGELKDAGVGLIYIKDYDTLRELFKANEKKEN